MTAMSDDDENLLEWLLPAQGEDASSRDGFLSTTAEVHAFKLGFFAGFYSPDPRPWVHDELPEPGGDEAVQKEVERAGIWYWRGGYFVGDVLQLAVLVMLVRWGLQ